MGTCSFAYTAFGSLFSRPIAYSFLQMRTRHVVVWEMQDPMMHFILACAYGCCRQQNNIVTSPDLRLLLQWLNWVSRTVRFLLWIEILFDKPHTLCDLCWRRHS